MSISKARQKHVKNACLVPISARRASACVAMLHASFAVVGEYDDNPLVVRGNEKPQTSKSTTASLACYVSRDKIYERLGCIGQPHTLALVWRPLLPDKIPLHTVT